MMRWLACVLAALVLSGAQAVSAHEGRDFIAEMTVPLAVDPATAASRADDEIAAHADARNSVAVAAAYWVKAQAAFRLGDNVQARSNLLRVRRLPVSGTAQQRIAGYADLLDGLLQRADGDYAGAFNRLRAAQRQFIAARDPRGQALALQSVGVLFTDVGNGRGAIRYFQLAKQAYGGDDVFFLSLYNNLGVAYSSSEEFVESNVHLTRARDYARRLNIDGFISRITLNIAFNQVFSGDLTAAENTLREFERTTPNPSPFDQREILHLQAQIAYARGDLTAAVALARRALGDIDTTTSDSSYWKAHQVAYRVFRAAGLRNEALSQLEALRRLDEADEQLTASNRAALLSAQFQFDAQETQIARLKAETLEQEVSFQRTITATTVVGSLIVLALLGGLLATAIRARKRAEADGAELSIVNQRLEQALAAKTEFLASTSHELRTPLNGILGMTQILLADGTLMPRHRAQIELLHDAGTTMRSLVDDILDVAKIEHGGFTIASKPTDVAALVRRVVRLFDAQASNAGLSLDVVVDMVEPVGLVDPDRMTQILFNLVGNALKFTQDGTVSVSLRQHRAADGGAGTLELAVQDTGIGIAPEWHDGVFDMFRQVDGARNRNYGGTGLGLAICRQLARAMGGDIALASAPGSGSTFTVALPWVPAELTLAGRPASETVDTAIRQDASVAIIAGDPMRAAMLAAMARHAGHDPLVAASAMALSWEDGASDLTLLVDGPAWPATQAVVAQHGHAARIIVVGGDGGEGSMVPAGDTGVEEVPFTRNAVIAALARAHPQCVSTDPAPERLRLRKPRDIANGPSEASEEPNRPLLMSRN